MLKTSVVPVSVAPTAKSKGGTHSVSIIHMSFDVFQATTTDPDDKCLWRIGQTKEMSFQGFFEEGTGEAEKEAE